MTSTIQQRRESIMSHVYQRGHVSVRQLAEELAVSEATVRRDLNGLATEGLVELNHGGASTVRTSDFSFISESMRNVNAKRAIAQMACNLIADGDQLFLDSGTTCFQMTGYLRSKRSLSVIVSSIRTAQELNAPGVSVLLVGGRYRPDRMDTVGPIAVGVLEQFRGYRAFFGADGVGMDFGIMSRDVDSANIFTQAARNAKECILLADSSKFDNPSLYKITDFNPISTVITEKKPSPQWMKFFGEQNVKVLYPTKISDNTNPQE